ncbi:MAG TPA: replication initiator protein A [Bryobacteraceae bacterium]|nr:replication initiator protein A [Bryobacteraceae bacterium]
MAESAEIETEETRAGGKLSLLPQRHPNHDLFICDVLDAIPKDDMASMEHPIFSLATKPDTRVLRYEHKNVVVEIAPSVRGLATIYDKDILIYCISQLMAKKNAGEPLAQTLHVNAHDLLIWTNRETSGDAYRRLKDAFERLRGTTITTNIKTNGEDDVQGFGLIESFRIIRETRSGRMSELQVKLSDWVYRIIQGSEVLTLSRDYFRLRKPTDRRIYELARKHCGEQDEWKISLELLHKKTGASSHYREFKSMVRELAEQDHLPDYRIALQDDMVIFRNRMNWQPKIAVNYPILDPEAYHDAKLVAPGYDVYFLEQEWRDWWVESGMPELGFPGKAFVGFCKKRYLRNPNP